MALFLAGIGLYGMLAYSVSQRTRELGIRMAMGSTIGKLFQLIVYNGLKLLAVGLAIGMVVTLALSRLIRSHLFEVGPADPLIFAVVITSMVIVAILACLVPAHRATMVDPVEALNYE